jgi:hypothetical protein
MLEPMDVKRPELEFHAEVSRRNEGSEGPDGKTFIREIDWNTKTAKGAKAEVA